MKHFIAAAAATLLASAASAGGKTGKAVWDTLDQDQDGVITRSEARGSAALADKFDQYDANRDGVLSKKEFEASGNAVKGAAAPSSDYPATSSPAAVN